VKETAVESHIRYHAASLGNPLWRNNVGVAWQGEVTELEDGSILIRKPRPVRYGLCNESKQQNQNFKSSDWIGPTPVLIQEHHLNTVVGVFTAIETKHSDWTFNTSDKHCLAQKNFHDIVIKAGGYAGFATSIEDYRKIIKNVT
jgi:hypothetical protein